MVVQTSSEVKKNKYFVLSNLVMSFKFKSETKILKLIRK